MVEVRTDSWAAGLSEDQAWELFYRSRKCDWDVAAKWAVKEFKLPRMPSRSGFFAWRKAMQKEEHAHKIAESLIAREQAKDIAQRYNVTDEESVKAIMSAATDASILADNPKLAGDLIEMAMAVKDRQQREREIELEERKIAVKEDELKIAQRKLEIYEKSKAAAKKVAEDHKLTPEEREAKIRQIFGI